MKIFLLAVIAVLLYYSPDARNATGNILRKTADIVDTYSSNPADRPHNDNPEYFKVPNPFHTN
jgi:hypothetical protein